MNVILLEVSHWHAPLYFEALAAEGARVVAVSDRDRAAAERVARRFDARPYVDWLHLLDAEKPDFAFAFGRHCEMAAMGEALIARSIPFVLEKPCGLSADEVRRLCHQARARNLFVGVPLVQQFGPLADLLGAAGQGFGPCQAWFRFIAGPPHRYPASGCAWMLDPPQSGGGCFINLSSHFLYLALLLLPGVSRVSARMSNAVYREQVEDYALVVLEASDGSTAVVETGYLFPSGTGRPREVYYSLFGRNGCQVWWGERGGKAVHGKPWAEADVNLDSDPLYARFVAATLTAFRAGQPPPVSMDVMVPIMEVVDAAYASARTGQPVSVNITASGVPDD